MYVITDITPPVYLAVPMGPIFTFFVFDNFAIFLTLMTILGVFKNVDLKKQPIFKSYLAGLYLTVSTWRKTKSLHLTECFSTYIHVCGVCDKYQVWAKVTALCIMHTFILSFSFYGSRFKNNRVSYSQVRCWRSLVGVASNNRKYWELILPRFCPPAGNQIICKGGLQKGPFW